MPGRLPPAPRQLPDDQRSPGLALWVTGSWPLLGNGGGCGGFDPQAPGELVTAGSGEEFSDRPQPSASNLGMETLRAPQGSTGETFHVPRPLARGPRPPVPGHARCPDPAHCPPLPAHLAAAWPGSLLEGSCVAPLGNWVLRPRFLGCVQALPRTGRAGVLVPNFPPHEPTIG